MPHNFYDIKEKQLLKRDYPFFYRQLTSFLNTLDNSWWFTECYDQDGNGSRFFIKLHNGKNQNLNISSIKGKEEYMFEILDN